SHTSELGPSGEDALKHSQVRVCLPAFEPKCLFLLGFFADSGPKLVPKTGVLVPKIGFRSPKIRYRMGDFRYKNRAGRPPDASPPSRSAPPSEISPRGAPPPRVPSRPSLPSAVAADAPCPTPQISPDLRRSRALTNSGASGTFTCLSTPPW